MWGVGEQIWSILGYRRGFRCGYYDVPPGKTDRNRWKALSRRRLLAGLGASGVAVIAGCTNVRSGEADDGDGERIETETLGGDTATTDITDLAGRTVSSRRR